MALAATFLAAFFLAASREAVASAFFFAATLAVVDPLEGIGIGPFLETGREVFDNQSLRLGTFFTFLKIRAMSSGFRVSFSMSSLAMVSKTLRFRLIAR